MPRGTRDWGRVTTGFRDIAEDDTYILADRENVTANTTEWVFQLFNPTNSGKLVTVHRALAAMKASTVLGYNDPIFELWTITALGAAGAAVAPVKADPNSPDSVCTALFSGAAPTTEGKLADIIIATDRDTGAGVARATPLHFDIELYRYQPGSSEVPLRLRPGRGIAFLVDADVNSMQAGYIVGWSESAE